ncbi:MAG TPA: hypothetical protein VF883_22880 [Thermoanaerobaculia bacterium]|jgi:hypothetical protein
MADDDAAGLFLKYNYLETKDLCKQFLTLVSAILVFSLTFSEKIVGFANAGTWPKTLLAVGWSSMLGAIVAGGIGLLYITMAAGDAVYAKLRFYSLAARSYKYIVVAGALFVVGLCALIATAFLTIQ